MAGVGPGIVMEMVRGGMHIFINFKNNFNNHNIKNKPVNFFIHCNHPFVSYSDGGQSQEVCEKAYNGYYSYGDCGEQGGVASFDECCALTKQRQLDQPDRGINRFSYNGHK